MITITDIDHAANFLMMLKGKEGAFSAGVTLRKLVDQFILENDGAKHYRNPKDFTREEIAAMRAGNKLEAVKLYKFRSGKSLMESKQFVESRGIKYLMESGRYGPDGMISPGIP